MAFRIEQKLIKGKWIATIELSSGELARAVAHSINTSTPYYVEVGRDGFMLHDTGEYEVTVYVEDRDINKE